MEAAWKIAPLSSEHWIPSSSFISQYEKIHSRLLHTFSFQKDSLKTAIEVLEKLAETPQGRFLIQNRHLNIPHQNSFFYSPQNEVFLKQMPFVQALHYHVDRRRQILQNSLQNFLTITTIPCQGMGDVLNLDYRDIKQIRLMGLDTSPLSFETAFQQADQKDLTHWLEFMHLDPMLTALGKEESHILIIPECSYPLGPLVPLPDSTFLTKLYHSLKTGGFFITSFVNKTFSFETPPHSEQNILFKNILEIEELNGLDLDTFAETLTNIGFQNLEVSFDPEHIMTTVVAQK